MARSRTRTRSLAAVLATFALMTLSLGGALAHSTAVDDSSSPSVSLTNVHPLNEDSDLEEANDTDSVDEANDDSTDENEVDENDQGDNSVDENDQGQDDNS
ncbi:MAG: hypothetical protein E6I65_04050, partial [Chloroflexi bacterium]